MKIHVRLSLMFAVSVFSLLSAVVHASESETKDGKKKKVVYRSHTQLDFSGDTVQGKVRAPEVFYIFQRKRAEQHHVVQPPGNFDYHSAAIQQSLRKAIPK